MNVRNSYDQTVQEKPNTKVVCCLSCFWANLIQYGTNPVLAECRKKPNDGDQRFPYQVEVASAQQICRTYRYQPESEKTIQKRVSRGTLYDVV